MNEEQESIPIQVLAIPEGKKVVFEDEEPKTGKEKVIRPGFHMIGNGVMNRKLKNGHKPIDLFEELVTLSKASIVVLNRIRSGIVKGNDIGEVRIDMSDLTSSQQQQFQSGFKELSARGLVKRTKRSHYMINPNALIPIDYEGAIELWDSI